MNTTIIRHRVTPNGFDIVATEFSPFTARYQRYTCDDGLTILEAQHSFSTEAGAIALWEADA